MSLVTFNNDECIVCLNDFDELVGVSKVVFAVCQHTICLPCLVSHTSSGIPCAKMTPCCKQPLDSKLTLGKKKRKRNEPASLGANDVGKYFIMSPDLFRPLGFWINTHVPGRDESNNSRYEVEGFDLCVKLLEITMVEPEMYGMSQSEPFTNFGRAHGWESPDRDLGQGPYYVFEANINVQWHTFWQQSELVGEDPRLVLETWMLNMIEPVGEGFTYQKVVTYPNSFGFHHPKWEPLFEGCEDPTLFDRFTWHDEGDEYAMSAIGGLEDNHPLRWIGWERGMQYGENWKTIRDHVKALNIAKFWLKRA